MNFMNLTIALEAFFNKERECVREVTADKKVNSIKIRTPFRGMTLRNCAGFYMLAFVLLVLGFGRHGNPRMNLFHK